MAVRGNRGARPGVRTKRNPDATHETDHVIAPAECPARFLDEAHSEHKAAWDRYVTPLFWLTVADETKAIMWVNLWVEYNADPVKCPEPRIYQLRMLGNELGMDPGNRKRIAGSKRGEARVNGKPQGGLGAYS